MGLSLVRMRRLHGGQALTVQELRVARLLEGLDVAFTPHYVFQLPDWGFVVVDFLVEREEECCWVLECSYTDLGGSRAFWELRRRCIFLDYKFSLLRKFGGKKLVYTAFIEAPHAECRALARVVRPLLPNADYVAVTEEEVAEVLGKIGV